MYLCWLFLSIWWKPQLTLVWVFILFAEKTKAHDDDNEPPHRPSLHCGPFLTSHVVSEAWRSAGFNSTPVKESDVKSGELHFFIWGPAGTKRQGTLCKWDTWEVWLLLWVIVNDCANPFTSLWLVSQQLGRWDHIKTPHWILTNVYTYVTTGLPRWYQW